MAELFLSYSRKDAARAQRFTEWLEREGHDVWRDEDDIGGGASFSSEIEKALKECDCVLVLWSADSVQSAWVRDEACFGRDAGRLIPFTLDGAEPPLGFRQFQSIDLSKWKGRGEPTGAERIRQAIERTTGLARSHPQTAVATRKPPRLPVRVLAIAGIVLLAASAGSYFWWRNTNETRGVVIDVLASPTSPDRVTAGDYANIAAADMAAFLPTRFDRATVIGPADSPGRTSAYRMLISANRRGKRADASLTLSGSDGNTIIWSKSWSVADSSLVDLPQEISRSASQAAVCLTETQKEAKRLDQPALGLYVAGCIGIADPDWSAAQLMVTFERVVELSPDFARGWGSVAVARSILADGQQDRAGGPSAAVLRSAREAIAKARELDPRDGLSYLAEWHLVHSDPFQGLAVLDKGVALAPDETMLQARRSESLAAVGRMADSVAEAQRAVELDPLSSFTRSQYILALAYAGELSRAKADIADARRKWPNNPDIDWAEYAFQYRYGDPRVAEQLMPKALDNPDADMAPNRKLVAARLDPTPAKIDDAIAAFRARSGTGPGNELKLLLALGTFKKVDEMYALLEDPKLRPFIDPSLLFRPEFAPVRADPRFMKVAAGLGLVRYWRASGNWPDFCTSEVLKYDCKSEASKFSS